MKAQTYRDMGRGELQARMDELYQELFNLRFQLATRQLDNTERVKQVRRDIARVRTVLHEMELSGEGR
ncbi:MAG: 50S ribosomal protein L29 [Chloroflexi bacterium]|mgnify:CR=1 FL=1|nr:50S ribosomal protein L29 [Chloroflexota bacterium]